MNYGVILASGKGTRIKDDCSLPKQFRKINGVPVIIYTIRNMLKIKRFKKIYLVVPNEFLEYVEVLINEFIPNSNGFIEIISGGKERMDSIDNAISAIVKNNIINEDDVVVIHDGVRPFVTEKILNESIDSAKKYGAVVAAMPVSDTLLISKNGDKVDEIPNRNIYYKGQAPDSFKLKLFVSLLNKLSKEEREKITGTSQVCTLNGYPIYMIEGDEINFKITTSSDFEIAESIAKGGKKK